MKHSKFMLVFCMTLTILVSSGERTYATGTRRILFTSDRDAGTGLFRMDADGKNVVQIANDTMSLLSRPDWSPDGQQIAYLSRRDGYPSIYVIDAMNGSNPKKLTGKDFRDTSDPVWASTGRIAFRSSAGKVRQGLFSIKSDATDLKLILSDFTYSYCWSPDGSQIAYISDGIYVINVDGTGKQKINKDKVNYGWIRWAPDGMSLLALAYGGGKQGIFSVDIKTGATKQRISDQDSGFPSWSPDGKAIAFSISGSSKHGIFTVDASGRNKKQLTQQSEYVFSWSPDSKYIAFTSDRSRSVQIYSMALDGTDPRKITTSNGVYREPQLSPNGLQVVCTLEVDGKIQLVILNTDGSKQLLLKSEQNAYISEPIWTDDNKHVIFSVSSQQSMGLRVIDADGANQKILIFLNGMPASGAGAILSPDGKQIAYSAGGALPDIYIAGVDGKFPHRLSKGGGFVPRWSPDGKNIAYLSWSDNKVRVIKADGTNQHEITKNQVLDFAWSPNSEQIAYYDWGGIKLVSVAEGIRSDLVSIAHPIVGYSTIRHSVLWPTLDTLIFAGDLDGNNEIYSIKSDGRELTNLTKSPGDEEWFSLAP